MSFGVLIMAAFFSVSTSGIDANATFIVPAAPLSSVNIANLKESSAVR